jgi:hypothetical protein
MFPFRSKIQFYSSKTKTEVLREIEKIVADKKYKKAEGETVTGSFVIRTTNRLLFFNIVFCGDIYEFEGKTFITMFAKMRMLFEILLLATIGVAGTGVFILLDENRLDIYYLFGVGVTILLCGLFWVINYFQFKPALRSIKLKLE